MQLGTLFCPVFRTLGEKGSLHVQEPKKVPYITQNYSKEPKKVLKMVLKTHLEPFREPLKVPPVGQPKNHFFLRVYSHTIQRKNKKEMHKVTIMHYTN